MNYEDFKSGDIVVAEDGRRVVIQFKDKLNIVGENHWQPLVSFIDDHEGYLVYRPDSNSSLSCGVFDKDVNLDNSWNYKKVYDGSAVKEVTLEEVAEQFGVDVKKIRIKE